MWDLIVSVSDHILSFSFVTIAITKSHVMGKRIQL